MTDDAIEPDAVDPHARPTDEMPEARLGRGFFSPPDVTGAPAPAYEYPESASAFYTAALESLDISDSAREGGGAISELLEMLDEGDDLPAGPGYAAPPSAAVQSTPVQETYAEPRFTQPEPAPAPPAAAAPVVPHVEPAAASPLVPAPAPTEAPPPTAPVRIPAPVAPCEMCGMTVPVDAERGRCHLGHRIDMRAEPGRRGRLGR